MILSNRISQIEHMLSHGVAASIGSTKSIRCLSTFLLSKTLVPWATTPIPPENEHNYDFDNLTYSTGALEGLVGSFITSRLTNVKLVSSRSPLTDRKLTGGSFPRHVEDVAA